MYDVVVKIKCRIFLHLRLLLLLYYQSRLATDALILEGILFMNLQMEQHMESVIYTSSADNFQKFILHQAPAKRVKVKLYLSGGTATLLDHQSVALVTDG